MDAELSWRTVFPATDRAIYDSAGFGGTTDFGGNPAILVIDVVESFAGPADKDVFEAIQEYRTSCGTAGTGAIAGMAKLLSVGRQAGIPVVFTKGNVHNKFHCGDSVKGTLAQDVEHIYGAPIVRDVAPLSDEFVLEKTKASAFFGTPLASFLHRNRVDTLLVCGTSTSGCVRASVVDAFSNGFDTFVIEECVFDRSPMSHAVNLYEMNAKYASVVSLDRTLEYVATVSRAA